MKVSCFSLDDFIECLKNENPPYQSTIRCNIIRRPIDRTVRDSSQYGVVFQASAVIQPNDESEFILEMGFDCGKDYEDADKDMAGSETAKSLKSKLQEYAVANGLRVLPGIIGY